jgi:hypothetical protein
MLTGQIGRYEKRIAEEERLASEAVSSDLALAHRQAAMLYRSELAILRKRRAANVSQTLAEIW